MTKVKAYDNSSFPSTTYCPWCGPGWLERKRNPTSSCNWIIGDGSDPNHIIELFVQWCTISQAADLTHLAAWYSICYIRKLRCTFYLMKVKVMLFVSTTVCSDITTITTILLLPKTVSVYSTLASLLPQGFITVLSHLLCANRWFHSGVCWVQPDVLHTGHRWCELSGCWRTSEAAWWRYVTHVFTVWGSQMSVVLNYL